MSLSSNPGSGLKGQRSSTTSNDRAQAHPGRGCSFSIISTPQLPLPVQHFKSSDYELVIHHEGRIDEIPTGASTSRLSLTPLLELRPSRTQNLSTSDAILREVFAEKNNAKEHCICEERTEAVTRQRSLSDQPSYSDFSQYCNNIKKTPFSSDPYSKHDTGHCDFRTNSPNPTFPPLYMRESADILGLPVFKLVNLRVKCATKVHNVCIILGNACCFDSRGTCRDHDLGW